MKKLLQNALMVCGMVSTPGAWAQTATIVQDDAPAGSFDYKGYCFEEAMRPFFWHDDVTFRPYEPTGGATYVTRDGDTLDVSGLIVDMRGSRMTMFLRNHRGGAYGAEDILSVTVNDKTGQMVTTINSYSNGGLPPVRAGLRAHNKGCGGLYENVIDVGDIPEAFESAFWGTSGIKCAR